ncbi:hypothetical protein NMY22_g1989 [Coprinellus aureogranulatus]|nr:hypothetical protein NMY22_g1989 [Coprinellus aureogranulatus]
MPEHDRLFNLNCQFAGRAPKAMDRLSPVPSCPPPSRAPSRPPSAIDTSSPSPSPPPSLPPFVSNLNFNTNAATTSPHTQRPKDLTIPEKYRTPGLELPPPEEWWKLFRFPEKRKRKTLCNPDTARKLAEVYVPEGSKGKVVVEAWAGPGTLTRALLALPRERISKVIVLEEEPKFAEWLKPLQKVDDRLHVLELDAYNWASYTEMEQKGLLSDVETVDWKSGGAYIPSSLLHPLSLINAVHSFIQPVHPQLQFIAQLPTNVHGEQLVAQLARAIPDRKWLFRFGRVPLDLTTSLTMALRLLASNTPQGWKHRCKVGVMTEAAAGVERRYRSEELMPVQGHFYHPTKRAVGVRAKPVVDAQPVQPIRMTPLENPWIESGELDLWDFVMRNMFITKATPLNKGITGLGPGAQSLLKKLDDPSLPPDQRVDITKAPRELSLREWKVLVRVFGEWPFRPENLSIGGNLIDDGRY